MKFTTCLAAGIAALAMLASCSNESEKPVVEGEEGSITISLKGNNYGRAVGPAIDADENAIKKFRVYVFNANTGALEESEEFTGVTSGTMSGLSTGFPKKIVVVANAPVTFPDLDAGDDMSDLMAGTIELAYQTPANIATNGMVMIGEKDPVILSSTGTNNITLELQRLVAKVTLGSIQILPAQGYEMDDFEITGVTIQRAISETDIYGNPTEDAVMWGGMDNGSISVASQPYLYDQITQPFTVGPETEVGNYFYVLPNGGQGTDLKSTLLTLVSEYEGVEQYFPIEINSTTGDLNTNGMFIQSNNSYILHIVINNLGEGTTDPDVPPIIASVTVEVEAAPWAVDIEQKVIW